MGSLFTKRKSPTLVSEAVQTDVSFNNTSPVQMLPDPRSATREIIRTPVFVKVRKEVDLMEVAVCPVNPKLPYLETDIDAVDYLPVTEVLCPPPDHLYPTPHHNIVDEVGASTEGVDAEEAPEDTSVEIFVDEGVCEVGEVQVRVVDEAFIERETHRHLLLPKRLTFSPSAPTNAPKYGRTPLRVVDENVLPSEPAWSVPKTLPPFLPMWDQENSLFI